MSGSKQKLTITQWDPDRKLPGPIFSVMLNPSGYSQSTKIDYVTETGANPVPAEKKFARVGAETLELEELVLDGTGAVNGGPGGASYDDVETQVAKLKKVAYELPVSSKADRPVVVLVWGSLIFIGRVETITVKYTLFKPNGHPLRARVKLTFVEYKDAEEGALRLAAASTAALARQVPVSAGSSLPLMCFQQYQNAALYMLVARANDLTSFRSLAPGAALLFPALR